MSAPARYALDGFDSAVPRYEIHIKQRAGKWAPQCATTSRADIDEVWRHMKGMKRKLRLVSIENGQRIVLAKYEPITVQKLPRRKAPATAKWKP